MLEGVEIHGQEIVIKVADGVDPLEVATDIAGYASLGVAGEAVARAAMGNITPAPKETTVRNVRGFNDAVRALISRR